MAGAFEWNYQEGNFENGTGIFTELFIPWYGTDIEALTINFDIGKSIEFSLTGNIDNEGLSLTLFLEQSLSTSQPTLIDLDRSSFEIERGGHRGGFVSGSIYQTLFQYPPQHGFLALDFYAYSALPEERKHNDYLNLIGSNSANDNGAV